MDVGRGRVFMGWGTGYFGSFLGRRFWFDRPILLFRLGFIYFYTLFETF